MQQIILKMDQNISSPEIVPSVNNEQEQENSKSLDNQSENERQDLSNNVRENLAEVIDLNQRRAKSKEIKTQEKAIIEYHLRETQHQIESYKNLFKQFDMADEMDPELSLELKENRKKQRQLALAELKAILEYKFNQKLSKLSTFTQEQGSHNSLSDKIIKFPSS